MAAERSPSAAKERADCAHDILIGSRCAECGATVAADRLPDPAEPETQCCDAVGHLFVRPYGGVFKCRDCGAPDDSPVSAAVSPAEPPATALCTICGHRYDEHEWNGHECAKGGCHCASFELPAPSPSPAEPPFTMAIQWCPICGRTDRSMPLSGSRHSWQGKRCEGVPVSVVYEVKEVLPVGR